MRVVRISFVSHSQLSLGGLLLKDDVSISGSFIRLLEDPSLDEVRHLYLVLIIFEGWLG